MEDCLLTFSHLTSAAAGVVVFVFCITNLKKKILQSVAVCAGEGYVEAMISLVVFFPLPDFTMLTRPPVVCQTIFNKYIFTSFRSLHFFFFFPAHYTYSTKQNNNTSPPKFVFFFLSSGPISYRGAWQHQHSTVLSWSKFQGKTTPFNPGPTCGAFTASLQSI